ncbi:intercellular adhesion molecule 1-like [Salarias fasciatus]|uniref:Intercellular adhesion molecule 1-like n=1 Tax=Salarias fasciatus TaxID=181472 RepID=A0A672FT45_SALFA|nr:intercellular adhesion molecule 1-like [Salarias fasciatus]
MCVPGRSITLLLLLLLHLFGTATSSPVSIHTRAPPLPAQILPPSPLPAILPSLPPPPVSRPPPKPTSVGDPADSSSDCPLKMSPSALVVRFGDPVTVNCSAARIGFPLLGWEVPLEAPPATTGQYVVWSVPSMTEWSIKPACYALSEEGGQCDIDLVVTVYQPPERVSLSLVNHTGPLLEGERYTLQCTVHNVAPVEKLAVTFYSGGRALARLRSGNNTEKTPVTKVFTLDISPGKADDGAEYRCEARLDLGPEGPEHPPVVASKPLGTAVLFGPQLDCPTKLRVREGESLNCEVAGNPQPVVTWYRDGQVVALPARSDRKHAGKYTIWTKGLLGQKNFTVEVEVLDNSGTSSICNQHFILAVSLIQTIFWL